MPSTLECVLMRKCKIKKAEARRLVTEGQESLGIQDVEWSTQLEKECIRLHKKKEELLSQDRFNGLSPYLAFKVKEHEKNFNTTVEIKPLVRRDSDKSTSKQSSENDPQPTFQESATTKNLPPIARKKAKSKSKQDANTTKTTKSKGDSSKPTKPIRVRSPSPAHKPPKSESPRISSIKPTRIPSPTPPENPAKSRVRSPSPVQSETKTTVRTRSPSPANSESKNKTKARSPSPVQIKTATPLPSSAPVKPHRTPSPLIEKEKKPEISAPVVSRSQSPIPSQSNSSTMTDSSTSEMSSLSTNSEKPAFFRSVTPPPRPCTPPMQLPQSPKATNTSTDANELSPEVSYMMPGASSSEIESPTKRLAKLASMSIVSPMVRTKKMNIVRNAEFSAFEAPLNTPTHGRRRIRRSSHRSRSRSSSRSLSNSVHSVGDNSLSSAGSDSVHSYRASSRMKTSGTNERLIAINEFLKHWFDKKIVTLIVDNCPGPGPENDDASEYDPPSLLGVSDCEYESDAMYESDTLDDFDFFDDNGSVGSNSGAVYVDPGCAMLPMPKLEAVRPKFSKSNNPYDSNDEDESFSDDSDEGQYRRPFGRSNSNPPIAKRKGKKPPTRATSFDGYMDSHSQSVGVRKGRRSGKEVAREPPQRAASFDLDKNRKRDAV